MLETSVRLLRLLSLLQQRREWSGADLASRLEVTTRTVRNDVDKLRQLGYQVDSSTGPTGGYRLGSGTAMPPLLLDDDEAVAVAVGLRAAAAGSVTGIEDVSLRALTKLERTLPARLRPRVDALRTATVSAAGGGPRVDMETLTTIANSAHNSERLRFEYASHDGSLSVRDVEPHTLVYTGRRWYLLAWDTDRADWRTFRADRITPLPPLAATSGGGVAGGGGRGGAAGEAAAAGRGGVAAAGGRAGEVAAGGRAGEVVAAGRGGVAAAGGRAGEVVAGGRGGVADAAGSAGEAAAGGRAGVAAAGGRARVAAGPRFVPREPPGGDAAAHVLRGVVSAPWPYKVRVRLQAPAAVVAERTTPTSGRVTDLGDGTCELVTGYDSLADLTTYLTGFDVPFTVLEPPELRAHLRRIAERYRDASP